MEVAVQLIHRTGGLAVLAHPWALKNPAAIIRKLKDAGLHGIEAYRSDGKLAGMLFKVQDGFLLSVSQLVFFGHFQSNAAD